MMAGESSVEPLLMRMSSQSENVWANTDSTAGRKKAWWLYTAMMTEMRGARCMILLFHFAAWRACQVLEPWVKPPAECNA